MNTYKNTNIDCIYLAISLSALMALMIACSGCTIKAEFGYHGKTGRDDTTYTVEDQEIKEAKAKKYRY